MAKTKEPVESYDDILDRTWDEMPETKVLPDGDWLLKGRNAAFVAPKGDGNAKVLFFYTPEQAMEDVDPSALEALGEDYDLKDNQIVFTIWIENNRDWQAVRRHLAKHGVDPTLTIREQFKKFRGTETIARVGLRTFTNAAGESVPENTASDFREVEG